MQTVTKTCEFCHQKAEHTKRSLGENRYQYHCTACGATYTRVSYTDEELVPTEPAMPNLSNLSDISDEDLIEFAKKNGVPATARWKRETIIDRLKQQVEW